MKNIIKILLLICTLMPESVNAFQSLSKSLQKKAKYFGHCFTKNATVSIQRSHANMMSLTSQGDSFKHEPANFMFPSQRNQDWFRRNSNIVRVPVCAGSMTDLTSFTAPLSVLKIINAKYVAIDVEATGGDLLDKRNFLLGDKVTELACVEIQDMKVTGNKFHSLINPCREVTPVVQKITGYTWQFLEKSPLFEDIVDGFLKYIEGKVIIVHDASLDIPLLNKEIKTCGRSVNLYESNIIIDTLSFANNFYPLRKKNLNKICHSYGVDTSQRKKHSALLDADLLARLFCVINRQGDFVYTTESNSLSAMNMEDFKQLDLVPEYFKNQMNESFLEKCRFKQKLYHPRFMNNYPAILYPYTNKDNALTQVMVSYLLSKDQENVIKEVTGKDISINFMYIS